MLPLPLPIAVARRFRIAWLEPFVLAPWPVRIPCRVRLEERCKFVSNRWWVVEFPSSVDIVDCFRGATVLDEERKSCPYPRISQRKCVSPILDVSPNIPNTTRRHMSHCTR